MTITRRYLSLMRGRKAQAIAALLAVVIFAGLVVSAARYAHAYGTLNVVGRPVHLYIDGYRFEPVDRADLSAEELARFRPGAPHLHSVGTWSLFPVVGGAAKTSSPQTATDVSLQRRSNSGTVTMRSTKPTTSPPTQTADPDRPVRPHRAQPVLAPDCKGPTTAVTGSQPGGQSRSSSEKSRISSLKSQPVGDDGVA